jgi:hypothetical protein
MSKLRDIAVMVINGVVSLSDEELSKARLSVCEDCEFFAHMTRQCRHCWCFMDLKSKILNAHCPCDLW